MPWQSWNSPPLSTVMVLNVPCGNRGIRRSRAFTVAAAVLLLTRKTISYLVLRSVSVRKDCLFPLDLPMIESNSQ